jgi:hypothetical protein
MLKPQLYILKENCSLARPGLAFEAEGHGDYSYDSAFKEASLILYRSKVDALVCGNDLMAIGARCGNMSAQTHNRTSGVASIWRTGAKLGI